MSSTFQRAHRADQKALRRQTILAAARLHLTTQPLPEITIASIAREAGLAKGSVYSYFATREEVFLALLIDELRDWLDALDGILVACAAPHPVARVVTDIIDTLTGRETMLRLLARLAPEIQANLSREAALAFNQWWLKALTHTGSLLERALGITPTSEAVGTRHMLRLQALCAGIWPMAHPSNTTAEVLTMPEFEPLCVDFWAELRAALTALFSHVAHAPLAPLELPWSI